MQIEIRPIGTILTPFESSVDIQIQAAKSDAHGEAHVLEEYIPGLESLDSFSHIVLVYWFHEAVEYKNRVKPYLDETERGIFSTRAPPRPNPIGISTVELVDIKDGRVLFKGADMLNKTPLLDIKPFVPAFDNRLDANSGWLERVSNKNTSYTSDGRFDRS